MPEQEALSVSEVLSRAADLLEKPGAWTATLTIAEHDGMPACWQIDAEYHAVCTTQFCYAQETEANAHLIAAAPELYEAADAVMPILAMIEEGFWDDCPFPDVQKRRVAALRAALSKARPSNRGEA